MARGLPPAAAPGRRLTVRVKRAVKRRLPAARIATLLLDRLAAIDAAHDRQISERDAEIRLTATKLQELTFELARLKRLTFGAKTEAMTADQRRLFEETLPEDEAALQARIEALLNAKTPTPPAGQERAKRQPRRQPLPEHLRRVEFRHEPGSTTCATPECGLPMLRIGEIRAAFPGNRR